MKNNSKLQTPSKKRLKSSSHWHWQQRSPKPPSEPGVYLFLSEKNEVLYVGKARNLKTRLQSYTLKKQSQPKTELLLSKAKKLKWIKLESEIEAILVEAELIRTHQPRYNLRLKDDKSPLYIVFTQEAFPRVLTLRRNELEDKSKVKQTFGPYTSGFQTRKVLKIARKAFPYCNAPRNKKSIKPCFYTHLGLCPGVCTQNITGKDYEKILRDFSLFLKGKRKSLEKNLRKQMKKHVEKLEFEKASEIRNTLSAIKEITQTTTGPWIETSKKQEPEKNLQELWKILSPFLSATNEKVPSTPFSRIETYDASNLKGQYATSSMVVFSHGVPDKKEYRKFRIKTTRIPDDIQMIKETLTRRLSHREWPLPKLIIVDGGKGQVKAAIQALAGFGLHHRILVLGIEKRFESLVVFKRTFHTLKLPKRSGALMLIMNGRDEAHRFAKSYHQQIRQKGLLQTKHS